VACAHRQRRHRLPEEGELNFQNPTGNLASLMPVPNLKIGSWKVDKGLKLAIEAAGSARRLAAKLGVSQQAVQQLERIPAERVIEVERLTLVPRERLRPDLHPPRPDGLKR
jgi:hypothetical protein